ncbi:hypothetical protein QBC35DRAFT_449075 [Podospora australis]|uniref:Uncharacterized protein n=1 Tax=Podospora australis TaxID=1536484 RepID=A0AAN6X206_9PEZI|nr:hypothetical protein QBC35DRAFT_449075 [Podospora australis]
MAKRRAADALLDPTPAITKRARLDSGPIDSDTRARSPSPWPSIEDLSQTQQDLAEESRLRERQGRWREAFDRSELRIRQARQDYAIFRRNRLPSPAPSDTSSESCDDSDADEFGAVPAFFNLEYDDPQVEQVFGVAYAHRIQQRMRKSTRGLAVVVTKPTFGRLPMTPERITRSKTMSKTQPRACHRVRRTTRQSRQQLFYELDISGKARLVT